jgi:predicted RNase H-like nuclease
MSKKRQRKKRRELCEAAREVNRKAIQKAADDIREAVDEPDRAGNASDDLTSIL